MDGIIAAVPTPVDATGMPQREPFVEHCRWALENGCDGLNILGTTGEANSFDTPARLRVMNWAASGFDASRLMVGTGTPSLAETQALTEHADKLGYRVALVLPPYFYKPATDEGLYRWYRTLHELLGSRAIAIYFYNFPQMTGIAIPVPVIERLRSEFPERFRGIKDSSGDLDYCRMLAARLPGFRVFPSSETALGEAQASGFAGCISATVNLSAPLCTMLWHNREAPPGALPDRVADLRSRIAALPLIPSVKYLIARRTGDMAWTAVLPPLTALSAEAAKDLDQIFIDLSLPGSRPSRTEGRERVDMTSDTGSRRRTRSRETVSCIPLGMSCAFAGEP